MELQVNRWGNSLAVRLPSALAKDLGLTEGSTLSPQQLGERLLAVGQDDWGAVVTRRRELLARIRKLHKDMPQTQPIPKDELSRY